MLLCLFVLIMFLVVASFGSSSFDFYLPLLLVYYTLVVGNLCGYLVGITFLGLHRGNFILNVSLNQWEKKFKIKKEGI